MEVTMMAPRLALPALALFAAAALAAPYGGGNAGGGGWHGGGSPGYGGSHPGGGYGHWHGSVGIYYGGPYWGWGWPGYYGYYSPWYYGYYWPGYYYNYGYAYGPYGYVPQTVNGGVTYIEREPVTASTTSPPPVQIPDGAAPAPPSGTQWWYLCNSPRGAYPYVRECPGGWERVPAVPPSGAIK
jgi:hypothetical protein